MGLFDDAGVDDKELAVSSKLAKGIYDGIVSDVEIKTSKAGDPYLVFSYDLSPAWEWPIQDWFRILPNGKKMADLDDTDDSFNVYTTQKGKVVRQTEKAFFTVAYRNIKRRLMDLGVAEDKVNAINPVDLKGYPVRLSIGENPKNDFPVIDKVSVPGASGTSLPGAAPVAPTLAKPMAPTIPSVPTQPTAPALTTPEIPANPFA